MAINKRTPSITPGNTVGVDGSYPQTVQQVQQYWNNVVNQQYDRAGVARTIAGGGPGPALDPYKKG